MNGKDNSSNHGVELKEDLRRQALALGFDVAAFAAATPPPGAEHLNAWLAAGGHADMEWMARHADRRADPRLLLPGVGVILCLGVNGRPPGAVGEAAADPGGARIAAYACHGDYHDVLKKKLGSLSRWLAERLGGPVDGRLFVDTAPVLEKPLAAAAGLGWQGKNTLLVNRRFGCRLFLAEFFIALPLPPDEPLGKNHCGSCDRCQRACPTGALDAAWRLDAGRCLAYWNTECRGVIPHPFRAALGNRVFGCDDCLTACPWNRFAPVTGVADFLPRPGLDGARLVDLARLDDAGFRALFRGTPVKRLGVALFLRNVAVALGNWGDAGALPALGHLLRHEAPLVRGHAAWGVGMVARKAGRAGAGARGLLSGRERDEGDAAVLAEIRAAIRAGD